MHLDHHIDRSIQLLALSTIYSDLDVQHTVRHPAAIDDIIM
jgi:hypothetical protein